MSLMPAVAPIIDVPPVVVSVTTTGVYPTLMDGDYGILMECDSVSGYPSAADAPRPPTPPGWTLWIGTSVTYRYTASLFGRLTPSVYYRKLTASLSGTSIGSTATNRVLIVLRHPRNRILNLYSTKLQESTHSFSGSIDFTTSVNPIVPVFCTVKALLDLSGGYYVPITQNYPSILFDGTPGAYYGIQIPGMIARLGVLAGQQAPRPINVTMDAAYPGGSAVQYTRHASGLICREP